MVLVFGKFEENVARVWFFFTPLLLFSSSFIMVGSGGHDLRGFLNSPAFNMVVSCFAESILITLTAPILDFLSTPGNLKRLVLKYRK